MERVGIPALAIHGAKDQKKKGLIFSVSSNRRNEVADCHGMLTARGIDIPDIEIINYDLPEEPENYVHRVGRPGRERIRARLFLLR